MASLNFRLFAEAQAIVDKEIAKRGQGSLIDAMRTVTAPAILDLITSRHRNAAARWVVRLDGAKVWRNAGKVQGTQALARMLAEDFLDEDYPAKARMLWKAIVIARYSSYFAGANQIKSTENAYRGKRSLPADVVEFLDQCRELTEDVKAAFFAGVQEFATLCRQFRWKQEEDRIAALTADIEAGRRSRAPGGDSKRKMSPQWFRELLAAARGKRRVSEFQCDALADLLTACSVTAIVAFKRSYLLQASAILSKIERIAPDSSPDERSDVATATIALGVDCGDDAKAIRKMLELNRAGRGASAAAFESPDMAFRLLDNRNEALFVRIKKDLGE
jgi:hypothetical protein